MNFRKKIEEFIDNEELEDFPLPKCNAFLRRLIYQTANEKFSNKISLKTKGLENKDRVIYVARFRDPKEAEAEALKEIEAAKLEFEDVKGLSKVIKAIANSVRKLSL